MKVCWVLSIRSTRRCCMLKVRAPPLASDCRYCSVIRLWFGCRTLIESTKMGLHHPSKWISRSLPLLTQTVFFRTTHIQFFAAGSTATVPSLVYLAFLASLRNHQKSHCELEPGASGLDSKEASIAVGVTEFNSQCYYCCLLVARLEEGYQPGIQYLVFL
jgi:hypothetical protein